MLILWFLCGLLLAAVMMLLIKIVFLKKSIGDICAELKEHLLHETNTLVSVSTGDKHVKCFVSELNKQLRLLRKQRQQYASGDRELKEAVTNISHDLRTPLTAICGYLDLLENTEKSETADRYIDAIKDRTAVLKQLTEELFCYSMIASLEREIATELIILNDVLEESIAGFYALLQSRAIVPSIHIVEKKVVRKLNQAALSRVFANLLNNAIAYSDGDLDITLTEAGELLFTNTASGLNEIQVGKLFDRFFTVESARKSTGLGLAIARTLIEQMNGSISAEYENNRLSIRILLADNNQM